MSQTLYSFDAGALMTAHRYRYPFDMFPSVWSKLAESFRRGRVFLCEETFAEIDSGDALHEWAHRLKKENPRIERGTSTALADFSEAIRREYVAALRKARAGRGEVKIRLSDVDFMIVAHAKDAKATVVTEEVPSDNPYGQKIPNVCRKMGVPCMNFLEFMRNEDYRF